MSFRHNERDVDETGLVYSLEVRHGSVSLGTCIGEHMELLLHELATLKPETSWDHQLFQSRELIVPRKKTLT